MHPFFPWKNVKTRDNHFARQKLFQENAGFRQGGDGRSGKFLGHLASCWLSLVNLAIPSLRQEAILPRTYEDKDAHLLHWVLETKEMLEEPQVSDSFSGQWTYE